MKIDISDEQLPVLKAWAKKAAHAWSPTEAKVGRELLAQIAEAESKRDTLYGQCIFCDTRMVWEPDKFKARHVDASVKCVRNYEYNWQPIPREGAAAKEGE